MTFLRQLGILCLGLLLTSAQTEAEPSVVWLTHRTDDPAKLCVNWLTVEPAASIVHYGDTEQCEQSVRTKEAVTLHHVEVPFGAGDSPLYYSIESQGGRSGPVAVQRYGGKEFRAVVVADWQARPDLSAVLRDRPHLLLIAGDQVNSLHEACGPGVTDCVKPFATLVGKYREFRGVPVLPVLGNHDREIRPRGSKPPAEPVYDIEATAWRSFYPTPGDGWKWRFDVPEFDLRLIGLDLQHTSDFGTTWQSGHDFRAGSPQFDWCREEIARRERGFVITLQNERNATMRGYEKGAWHQMFRQGSAVVTGFGYFAERAVVDGLPYFNTALGSGAKYPDPHSKFFAAKASYLLFTFTRGAAEGVAELKSLDGEVLDRSSISRRQN